MTELTDIRCCNSNTPTPKKVGQKSALFSFSCLIRGKSEPAAEIDVDFMQGRGGGDHLCVWPHVACPKTPFPISGSGKPFGQEGRKTMWVPRRPA